MNGLLTRPSPTIVRPGLPNQKYLNGLVAWMLLLNTPENFKCTTGRQKLFTSRNSPDPRATAKMLARKHGFVFTNRANKFNSFQKTVKFHSTQHRQPIPKPSHLIQNCSGIQYLFLSYCLLNAFSYLLHESTFLIIKVPHDYRQGVKTTITLI